MNGANVELKHYCSEGWRSSEGITAVVQLVAWCFEQWTTYLALSGGYRQFSLVASEGTMETMD